jgi:galactokinase
MHFVFDEADSVQVLDCRSITHCYWTIEFGVEVMIGGTRSKCELAGSEYSSRRAQCEDVARRMSISALYDVTFDAWVHRRATLPAEVFRRRPAVGHRRIAAPPQ